MTTKLLIWAGALGLVALAIWGALSWHDGKVQDVYASGQDAGRKEVQERWDKAVEDAKKTQSGQNTAATATVTKEVEVIRNVFHNRIKEVTRYVPNPDTHCPADADFVRMFNGGAAGAAGQARDQ
jgi:hypothetical protein